MDDTEIQRCVNMLAGYWPNPALRDAEVMALVAVLRRYDVRDFDRTIELLVEEGGHQFRPAPGELAPLVRDSHVYLERAFTQPPGALDPGSVDDQAQDAINAAGLLASVEALAESQRLRTAAALGEEARPPVDPQYAIWDDPPPPQDRTLLYHCRTCQDTHFKELDSRGQGVMKPCPDCRPGQHALWAAGGYLPDWDPRRPNKERREQIVRENSTRPRPGSKES